MRVIVAGATAWSDGEAIRRELEKLPAGSVVIHGDAPGADELAGQIAAELGLLVEPMAKNQEDYARFSRGAWKGLNQRMLAAGAELVLGFHPDVQSSSGTKHMIRLAEAARVEVRVYSS